MHDNSALKRVLLASASAAAMILVAGAAQAQTAAPAASPPQAEAPAATVEEAPDDIIVTGIRASIQRAQDIKRFAPTIIEAVTFEDLGKFSDLNLADSLQRVPGVQIQRNDDGYRGDRASIRGLGPQFVQVTVNGRDLVTYGKSGGRGEELRSFNLDQIPTELIGGLTVYKTSAAETVEPGIGGLLDLQTLRPLDYKSKSGSNFFGSISARGELDEKANKVEPRISAILGGKFFDDTLGIYVSGLTANTITRVDGAVLGFNARRLEFSNPTGPNTVVDGVLTNGQANVIQTEFTRNRKSGSVGIQWRPTSNLEVNGDFTYNKYRSSQLRNYAIFGAGSVYDGVIAPGEVTIQDNIASFTGSRNGAVATNYSQQAQSLIDDAETKYGGVNAKWTSDKLTLSADYGHSDVNFFSNYRIAYSSFGTTDPNTRFGLSTASGVPVFTVPGNLDAVPKGAAGYYGEQKVLRVSRDSFKLDGKYEVSDNITLKAGARYARTHVDSRGGDTFACLPSAIGGCSGSTNSSDSFGGAPNYTFTNAQLAGLVNGLFPGGTGVQVSDLGVGPVPNISFAGFCAAAQGICNTNARTTGAFRGAFPTTVPAGPDLANGDTLTFQARNSYLARERNIALYGAVDAKGSVLGIPFDANAGLRAVNIQLESRSFASVSRIRLPAEPLSNVLTPTRDTNSYWTFLPNINANFHPADNLTVRLGFARAMTLPEFLDTAPVGSVRIIDPSSLLYDPVVFPDTATFGNTRLKPIMSSNFDLTFEYYTASGGALIVSLFDKELSDVIIQSTELVTIPGQSGNFQLTGPFNVNKAYARGIEISGNQPLTFLPSPFDGLGVQASYTYFDSKLVSTLAAAQDGLPGSSKHNANVVAYYEKYGVGVRLGYTYRSRATLGNNSAIGGFLETPISNLDLNLTYALTKNIEFNGSIQNLTGENRVDYNVTPNAIVNYFQRPRVFTFGVRASF